MRVLGREVRWTGPPPAEAPTVVFLHEGLGSAGQWRDLPARLGEATGCGTLAYSRLGYGASDPRDGPFAPSFMHEAARCELPALLEAAGVREAVLFGHSDGATIALLAAAEAGEGRVGPARLRGVVVEAPHVFVEEITVRSIAALRGRHAADPGLRARFARHHGANALPLVAAWTSVWLSPAFRPFSIEAELPRIDVPLLVIAGDADEYGTRAQVDAITARVPRARSLWLPGCGHAPHRDAPEAVLRESAHLVCTALAEGRPNPPNRP